MTLAANDLSSAPAINFLIELEHRHNDVLEQLDELNHRVEQALAEARRQFSPSQLISTAQPA